MESTTPDQQWSNIPQDILTQIFKYLPIAPDRWHCLFVSKAFHSAMQSRLLWTHITLQDCSVMPKKRGWDELERRIQKPKKLEFITAAFLGYLKKNHRDVVVELNLSHAAMESEGEFLPRKFNIQYNPEYNDDHMNVFWSLMFDFPNLRNLSLFGAFFTSGSQSSFGAPVNKSLRSSVRNLNLLKENIFYHSRDTFKTILEYAPELEVLQIQDISEDSSALTEKHHKLKHLLLVLCTASPVNVAEYCPNLEVFVNHKYEHHWGEPEEPPKLPRDSIIFISGERKPLRELSPDDITQRISKAIVNTRYATSAGLPQLHDLVKNDNEKLLELSLSVLKLDPNIKFRTAPDVVLDPFVLQYPYDSQSDNRGWADEVTETAVPPLLEAGDTPLHYAVKRKKIGLVHLLLENGANPNAQNSAYRTPLCYVHSMGMLNILLNRGASLDVVDKDGWNLLMNFVANKTRLYPNAQAEEIQDHFSFNSSSIAPEDSDRLKLFQHLIELGCDVNYHAPNGLNALKIALSVNDNPVVEYLLKHMKEPLVEKSPCVSLLSCVASTSSPDLEMIEKLLEMGADPAVVDERGQTYLHVAAERNQLHLLASVEHVKDRAKLLSLTDSAGFTFLHYAVLPPSTEVIWECDVQHEYLQFLSKKCKPNMTEQTESLELFLTLVDSDGVINTQAVSGETPLLLACRSMTSIRREDIVRRLLAHGANPNIVDHDGGSPLIAAAYALDDTVVKQLIEAGADVAHCDNKGFNALLAATFAVSKRFMEVKSHNYHQGLRDGQKKSVKETDRQGFIKIFNVLLKNKISVNQQEKLCGLSVLHILSSLYESEAVEWINTLVKDHGANVNSRTLMNETPLHYAIRSKCLLPAKTLLQLGADVNARGIGMMTPLHYVLDISYSIHGLNNTSLTEHIKISIDGHKIVANTLIRYPSWMWSSPDDRSQNPTSSYYDSETDHMVMLFMELFRHAADKLDFNAQSYMGNLPLHNCWQLAKSVVDPGNVSQGVVEPKHYLLSIPLVMLKYATREQLLTKNFSENTPFDSMLGSVLTMLKPSVMAGTYPSVKEGFDMIFKRCLDLVGDTIDVNHVITTAALDIEFSVVEMLAKKAKENGKFSFTDIKPSVQVSSSTMLSFIVSDPKLYALFKDFAPLFATYLPREAPKPFQPMIFSLVISYQAACGYDDKASRPKSLDDLLKLTGIDWKLELSDTKENLLLAAYTWWRNTGAESLLYNMIHSRKNIIEADKLIADLINVGVDPHQKNIIGQSFADMVPQYEKIVENAKYLKGEEKRAIQKESYWTDKKPSMLMELLKTITC